LTSQLINRIVLIDVPFYLSFDKPFLAIVVIIVLISMWGGLTIFPESLSLNLLVGSLTGGVGFTVISLIFDQQSYTFITGLAKFLLTFLPAALIFLGMSYVLVWSVRLMMRDYFVVDRLTLSRLFPLFIALFLAALIGFSFIKSSESRRDMRLVHAYLQEAKTSRSSNEMPGAVKDVNMYIRHAKVPYTLEASNNTDLFTGEAPQGTRERSKGIIIARFEDGFRLTCLTLDESTEVFCEEYSIIQP